MSPWVVGTIMELLHWYFIEFSKLPVIYWRRNRLGVGVCDDLDVPEPGHVAKAFHQVVADVVGGDVKSSEIDKRGDGQHRERAAKYHQSVASIWPHFSKGTSGLKQKFAVHCTLCTCMASLNYLREMLTMLSEEMRVQQTSLTSSST